jgi:raffinose/stachyose/melibiose transport system permease protein
MLKRGTVAKQLVFIGPAFLVFAVIVLAPFCMNLIYSFTEWNGVSGSVKFVGLDNFKRLLFDDPDFISAFWFTIRFSLAEILLTNLVGFAMALLLVQAFKTKNTLRTIFFMPNVIGGLLLGFIWQFIFVKGFASIGDMTGIGFFNLPWLGDAATAFWGIVIVAVWQGAGYLMIIYIAALGGVPQEIVEAARIDGAGRWVVLRKIVIPMIMPAFTICLFLTISWAFKMFDLNLSLTKGGPYNSTESVALNIYQEAFRNNRYGLGTAKSLVFFVVVAIISIVQVRITKKREVEL